MSGNAYTLPPELVSDWRSLDALLEDVGARQPIPCRTGDMAPLGHWTSDEHEDQREAAIACQSCAALTACRTYGIAHPKEAGVLGGLTETERRAEARKTKEK